MVKLIINNILGRVRSAGFWIMAGLTVIILCIAPVGNMALDKEIPLYRAVFTLSDKDLLLAGEYMSSYNIVMSIHAYEWFVIISPVIFCFTAIRGLKEALFGGAYAYTVTRISKAKYVKIEFVSTIICTIMAVIAGFLIFTLAVYVKFPNLDRFNIPEEYSVVRRIYGLTGGARLLSYLKMLGNIIMVSILMAELSVLFLICFKDVFYALNIPMLIMYLGTKLLNLHLNLLRKKYGLMYSFRRLIPELFNPYYLLVSMPEDFGRITGMGDIWYFSGFTIVLIILAFMIVKIMNKYNAYQ